MRNWRGNSQYSRRKLCGSGDREVTAGTAAAWTGRHTLFKMVGQWYRAFRLTREKVEAAIASINSHPHEIERYLEAVAPARGAKTDPRGVCGKSSQVSRRARPEAGVRARLLADADLRISIIRELRRFTLTGNHWSLPPGIETRFFSRRRCRTRGTERTATASSDQKPGDWSLTNPLWAQTDQGR